VTANAVYSVSGASLHNLTQGLTLGGKVSGAGLTKTGNGTLVLGDATNDFTGNVTVQRGVLSISAEGQLGNAANKVVLTPASGGTSTLRFTEDLSFGRSIVFGNTTDTRQIEVSAGKTVTLTSAFERTGGAAAALTKQATGTLVLGADNTGWTGALNINMGVVRASAANQLTAGILNIGGMTAALELTGGVTLAPTVALTGGSTTNASTTVTVASTAGLAPGMLITGTNIPAGATIASVTNATQFVLSANATATASSLSFNAASVVNLTSTGDWANITGIDSLGAIRSTNGVNVINGQLRLLNPVGGNNNVNRFYGVGADLGATLTLGPVRTDMTTTDNRNIFFYLLGKGTINIAGDFINTNATGTDRFHVNQVDDNIVNVSAANAFAHNHYRI